MKYIVKIDNNQYLLEENKKISIQVKPDLQVGDSFEITDILLAYNDKGEVLFDNSKVIITALVEKLYKEEKIIVFKKRRRKNSQRKRGHRQRKMLISFQIKGGK